MKQGIHCLKPDYIAEYLSKGSEVQMEALYINEVRPLLQRYNNKMNQHCLVTLSQSHLYKIFLKARSMTHDEWCGMEK